MELKPLIFRTHFEKLSEREKNSRVYIKTERAVDNFKTQAVFIAIIKEATSA